MGLRLGIDVGGTCTDAALVDSGGRVVAWSKVATTTDPAVGLTGALDRLLASGQEPEAIETVGLSTTLATNALVEGTGGPVGLVFIGFQTNDVDRAGLRGALAGGTVILAEGGHDAQGVELAPLDLDEIRARAEALAHDGPDVDAFAVTARFGVRNPDHELRVREALADLGKPVTCGHELSASLDGPRRALTCVLNAGLTTMIGELCRRARQVLDGFEIAAPLLVMRGDGSLVAAELAANRPIETILSGPAASLAGAAHLIGGRDAVVVDTGGTTTDVGLIDRGRPRVGDDGAVVGGHRTMVSAVDVTTVGLGGDSEVSIDARSAPPRLVLGPRRVEPVGRLGLREPEVVAAALAARRWPTRPDHVRFVRAADRADGGRLDARAGAMLARLDRWRPVDEVVSGNRDGATLRSLNDRHRVRLAGFTPTDAARTLTSTSPGGFEEIEGDREIAHRAATLLASCSDGEGNPLRPDGSAFARWVMAATARGIAETVLAATFAADGLPPEAVESPVVAATLDRRAARIERPTETDTDRPETDRPGTGTGTDTDTEPAAATVLSISPRSVVVGLGGPAATHHPTAAHLLGAELLLPELGPVAGAVGAAVGLVRVTRRATITQPSRGQYRIHLPGAGPDRGDPDPAIAEATDLLTTAVRDEADRAGARTVSTTVEVERRTATIEGRTVLVEAVVTVVGEGPPRPG